MFHLLLDSKKIVWINGKKVARLSRNEDGSTLCQMRVDAVFSGEEIRDTQLALHALNTLTPVLKSAVRERKIEEDIEEMVEETEGGLEGEREEKGKEGEDR